MQNYFLVKSKWEFILDVQFLVVFGAAEKLILVIFLISCLYAKFDQLPQGAFQVGIF